MRRASWFTVIRFLRRLFQPGSDSVFDVEPHWAPTHELGNDIAVPSVGKMVASITSVTFFNGKKGDNTVETSFLLFSRG